MPPKIPVKDFMEQLRLRAVEVGSLNEAKTGEELIPAELAQMKREIAEKRLLEYQVKVKKGDVNSFLASKYGEGTYNEAVFNGYDNSKARRDHGITYEYHVYFDPITRGDKTDKYANARPAAQYLVTKPIVSPNGDRYLYHLPVHFANSDKTEVVTDLDSEQVDSFGRSISKSGLVHALEVYQENIAKGNNNFDANSLSILRRHGFITGDGKFRGDVSDKNVEKYLLRINEKNRHNALQYLNEEFKVAEEPVAAATEEPVAAVEETAEEPVVPVEETAAEEPVAAVEETTAEEPVAAAVEETAVEPIKEAKQKVDPPPSQAPKRVALTSRELNSALSLLGKPTLTELDTFKTFDDFDEPFQLAMIRSYLKELAVFRKKAVDYIANVEADNFNAEEITAQLDSITHDASIRRYEVIAEMNKIAKDNAEIENSRIANIPDAEVANLKAMEEDVPKFATWYVDYDSRLEDVTKKTRQKFKIGDDYKTNFDVAITKFVADEDAYIKRFSAAWKRFQDWVELRDGFKELSENDAKASVKTALSESTAAVTLMLSSLQELSLDGFDKLVKNVKYGEDRYQLHLKNLGEKRKAWEKRRMEAEEKAARVAEAAAAAEAARIKAEKDAKLKAARELLSKDEAAKKL